MPFEIVQRNDIRQNFKMELAKEPSRLNVVDLYEVIEIPRFILQTYGQWPSHDQSVYAKIRDAITTLLEVMFCISMVIECVYAYEDFIALLELLTFLSPPLSYLIKMVVFRMHKEDFIILYSFLDDTTLKTISSNLQSHIQKPFQFAKTIGIGYQLCCGLTVTMTSLLPLIIDRNLPIQFTVFNLGYFHHFMYFLQIFGLFGAAAGNSCLDFIAMGLMCLIKGQVCVLNEKIRRIRKDKVHDLAVACYLGECVNHHEKIVRMHKEDFIILYSFLDDTTLKTISSNLQSHIQKPFQFAKTIGIGYQLCCGLTVTMTSLLPLIIDRNLPIQFTVFNLGYFHHFMYFLQIFGLFGAAAGNSCLDFIAMGLMCLIKGQVCVLNEKIRRIRKDKVHDLAVACYLGECVNHHEKIVRLVNLVEKVFSIILLIQYLTSIVVICNIGFQLVIVEIFSFPFLLMTSFFIAMMCQLGMYCWFGNEIILNSLAIRDACYESDWINSNSQVRKMLLIIMERSKKPLYLTAGKFSILSLTSFTSVINSAYSFFALMQRMYRKSEDN